MTIMTTKVRRRGNGVGSRYEKKIYRRKEDATNPKIKRVVTNTKVR